MGICRRGGRHGQSVENRMQGQAQRQAHPSQAMRGSWRGRMSVPTRFHEATVGDIVMMERQETLEEEHEQKTAEQPAVGGGGGVYFADGVRQQAQEGEAKHQAGYEADGDLQPGVVEL